ncbi:MAG TPA: Fe-S cluster assembly protein SufD [Tepidimicrobium sp.]|nr:Fe-S cluster assembly protein SufD [Tepidimicrobium sp.]
MINWNRIELKGYRLPTAIEYHEEYVDYEELPMGVELTNINKVENKLIAERVNDDITGVDKNITSYVMDNYNSGIGLYIPEDIRIDEPIRLNFNMDDESPMVIDNNIVISSPNSRSTLVVDYYSNGDTRAFHSGVTKVYAMENAVVNIIKIQRMNDHSYKFDSNIAHIERGAVVNWISIEIGSIISGSNYTSILKDEASEGNLYSIYLGDGDRRMDLEYTMIHKGRRSISNIETKGVLMDNSVKVFRGNLDFKRGARLSKGMEQESVVLLDPTVKSHSIPALMCDEDDVQGEHAASAGQVDRDQLLYLMSRGLDFNEAKRLIIRASFRSVLERIPMEELRGLIYDEIDRRIINGQAGY